MSENFLLEGDLSRIPALATDVLVIGSGIAGLSAALAAARHGRVIVTSKVAAAETNTYYAQGGIAVALSRDDSTAEHRKDTINVACGLGAEDAIEKLVSEGIERVHELVALGAAFDREGDGFAFATEGGHSRARILHAAGDATGRELEQVLLRAARQTNTITFIENCYAADLLHHEEEVHGAAFLAEGTPGLLQVRAKATILATGGGGQLYRETTNPDIATGDGVPMAFRAGAEIADIEFVQFHPTTLYLAGARRFLISEAVRGEGGILVNAAGERFLNRYDQRGELAPRDIVSHAIVREMHRTREPNVWLDMSHIPADRLKVRFPQILAVCEDYGLNACLQRIPVRPSAHYFMGGVKTDLLARTSVKRLFACGEVAASGVHGANRLASNSLLEGLVFGHQAGLSAGELAIHERSTFPLRALGKPHNRKTIPLDVEDVARSLKSLMWHAAGVIRGGEDLKTALEQIHFWRNYVYQEGSHTARGYELRNMLLLGELIITSALEREESRGAHYRTDYPERNDAKFLKRIVINRNNFSPNL